jgi:hypothetical protein
VLRINLSTRPFYNERLVHLLIGLAALLVGACTVYNVMRLVSLTQWQGGFAVQAGRDEAETKRLVMKAAQIRQGLDQAELQRITNAANEANRIIDARTFSWTELFNDIESTLPPNVMLTAVTPVVEEGVFTVRLVVMGRNVEGIDTFIERLEQTGRFTNVLASNEQFDDEGMYQATVEGRYRQQGQLQQGTQPPVATRPAAGAASLGSGRPGDARPLSSPQVASGGTVALGNSASSLAPGRNP